MTHIDLRRVVVDRVATTTGRDSHAVVHLAAVECVVCSRPGGLLDVARGVVEHGTTTPCLLPGPRP